MQESLQRQSGFKREYIMVTNDYYNTYEQRAKELLAYPGDRQAAVCSGLTFF